MSEKNFETRKNRNARKKRTYIVGGDQESEHGHVADVVGQVVGGVQHRVQVGVGHVEASGRGHGTAESQEHLGEHVGGGHAHPRGVGLEGLDVHQHALGALHLLVHLPLDEESAGNALGSITGGDVLQVSLHVGLVEKLGVLGHGGIGGVLASLHLGDVVGDVLGIGLGGVLTSAHLGLVVEREHVQGEGVVQGTEHVHVSQLATSGVLQGLDLGVKKTGLGAAVDVGDVLDITLGINGGQLQGHVRVRKLLDGGDSLNVLGLDLVRDELEVGSLMNKETSKKSRLLLNTFLLHN